MTHWFRLVPEPLWNQWEPQLMTGSNHWFPMPLLGTSGNQSTVESGKDPREGTVGKEIEMERDESPEDATSQDDSLVLPAATLDGGYADGRRHICELRQPSAPSIGAERADDDYCDHCGEDTAHFWIVRPQPYHCTGCDRDSEATWSHLVCYACLRGEDLPWLWDSYEVQRSPTDPDVAPTEHAA